MMMLFQTPLDLDSDQVNSVVTAGSGTGYSTVPGARRAQPRAADFSGVPDQQVLIAVQVYCSASQEYLEPATAQSRGSQEGRHLDKQNA
jgi:hypothetical protein